MLSLAPLVPFVWPLRDVAEQTIAPVVWVVVVASAVANVGVLAYHHLVPAHPKFLIVGFRRVVLRIHVFSGTLEFVAGIVALASFPSPSFATAMALFALVGHVPSACIQTAIVFGSRAIMRPAYSACIALHAFAAVMLLRHPDSQFWLVSTFLVFNIYVWCRIYYFMFDKFGFFHDSKYTVAILLAGLTTAPAVIGPGAVLALAGCCGVHLLLHAVLLPFRPGELADFVRERPRDSTHAGSLPAVAGSALPDRAPSDRDKARLVFDRFDRDGDGSIEVAELREVLDQWSLPSAEVEHWLRAIDIDLDGRISFDEFLLQMRPVWRFVYHDVVETRHGPRPDMIARALAAHRAESATRRRESVVRRELVAKVDFLVSAAPEFLDELAASMIERRLGAGQSLWDHGVVGEGFWIVRTGRARLERDGESVSELAEGHWFGEGFPLDGGSRSDRIVALTEAALFEISTASFRDLLDRHPTVARRIAELAATRLGNGSHGPGTVGS